eukprot:567233-Amphidinium_carterae.1
MEQVRELVEELQRMSARVVAAEQAASAAFTQAAAAQRQQGAQGGGHMTRLVDTRALGKPPEFKSVREDWKDCMELPIQSLSVWSQSRCWSSVTNSDAAGIQDLEIVLANLPVNEQEISHQIYLALCLQVSGVALTKLQNVESHNGLEAWRQLVLEFEPRTAGRRRLHLTNLL